MDSTDTAIVVATQCLGPKLPKCGAHGASNVNYLPAHTEYPKSLVVALHTEYLNWLVGGDWILKLFSEVCFNVGLIHQQ